MNLLQTLEHAVRCGYSVKFGSGATQAIIALLKQDRQIDEQYLPLNDHFNEVRLSACISFMIEKDQLKSKKEKSFEDNGGTAYGDSHYDNN